MTKKVGRPPISDFEKQEIVSKLEVYLKTGLSISTSLMEAQVPRATFYRLMEKDEEFRDKIERFKNFTSILLNNALVRELQIIIEKQNGNSAKGMMPQRLNWDDIRFLMWFALNNNGCKDEWGQREGFHLDFDPEVEIQRIKSILEENTTKELPQIN